MRFKFLLSLGLVLIMCICATTVFGSGVGLTGIGARATALAGSFRGVADDWSAMYWNPAGITQMQGIQFGVSLERIKPTAKFSPAKWIYVEPPAGFFGEPVTVETTFSNMKTDKTKNQDRTFYIPAFGVTYGMDNLAIGFSFYVPFGLGAKWDLLTTDLYNKQYPEFDYEDDLKVMDFHPTIAYKLSDKLSIGVGLSIVYSDIIIRTPKYVPNPYLITPGLLANFRTVLSQLGGTIPEFNHLLIDSELTGTGWGFGGNIGLLFNVTDDFKVGLSARYYNDIAIDGTINATAYFADLAPANELIQNNLEPSLRKELENGNITEKEYGVLTNFYSGGTSVVYDNVSGDTKLPLPMDVGIGFSYSGIENLLISGDISWARWSVWDSIEIDLDTGEKSNLLENWDDGLRFGLGLEYKLGLLTLRGGYYSEGSVVPNETLSPTIPDINKRSAFNLGLQYDFGSISLHVSYEKILIGDKTVKDYVFNVKENSYDNLAGKYGMDVYNIMTGLEYRF